MNHEGPDGGPGVMQLELTTPDRRTMSLDVTEVVVPGVEGVFTVLYDHTPILSVLDDGVLFARDAEGKSHYSAVHGEVVRLRRARRFRRGQ